MNKPKVTVGFVNYATKEGYSSEKYLKYFLESLRAQDYENLEILCMDNGSTDEGASLRLIQTYSEVKVFENERNLGFVAHNSLIQKATGDYYLCTNFDVILDPSFISRLVEGAMRHPEGGSFGGTVYHWNFAEKQKTDILDTTGIGMTPSHHFRDRECGDVLTSRLREERLDSPVFGISGVSVLYSMKALKSVAHSEGVYFDPEFFMYKEDVDLAYRLQWQGAPAWYIPKACMWHDRTLGEKKKSLIKDIRILANRSHKSTFLRKVSLRNHLFVLYKNVSWGYAFSVLFSIAFDELKKFFWVFLMERDVLGAYGEFWEKRHRVQRTPKNRAPREMEVFMKY